MTNRFEPVRGYISWYGGKLATIHVDDTQYPDGRVVVVPEELWDEIPIQLADTLDRAEPQAPRPLIVKLKHNAHFDDLTPALAVLRQFTTLLDDAVGVLIIPAELIDPKE